MSKSLSDLDPRFRPLAVELVARCVEAGIDPRIVDTLRTAAEQARNLAAGVSWTKNSKHLPQPPGGKSLAIDLAPRICMEMKDWAPDHPYWQIIGQHAEALGLRWGGRWKQRDMGHAEWVK